MSKILLFVPASDERKLGKVLSLSAPAFLLDLEDGVAEGHKEAARTLLRRLAPDLYGRKPCWVRVNPLDGEHFYADVEAALWPGLLGINLPKVESALHLQIADWYLSQLERERGLPPGSVRLMATVESARGVEALGEIAWATRRLECLCFGNADYSRDLGLDWPAPEGAAYPALTAAKVRLVQISAAAGLEPPHDGASAEFGDLEAVEREAQAAKQLGFGGKHAIHPAQIPVLERVFRPTQAQVAWAERVLAYHALHPEQGAFQLDGRMVDAPVIARARQILEEAGR
ncbi:HpcH/HpaI aldolase/citrate lyase family protein [Calidithermus roseus]|uniref:Citrate lyase subunit beta n=1 Tax=Calidithermus roseus TaxID=1644118 RepID=A0A399EMK7_9DEIN|nr:CoA ester lyase [Calidithermus roseus]RIH84279.1 Citrate lyase subunit beta [Calidithermus roseus]